MDLCIHGSNGRSVLSCLPTKLVLADGPNLCGTAKSLGERINFRKLLDVLGHGCHVVEGRYYTALYRGSPVEGLVAYVKRCGWRPIVRYVPESLIKAKGNMDHRIAPDLAMLATRHPSIGKPVDIVTLLSGDGDFGWALREYVKPEGVRIQVIGSQRKDIDGRVGDNSELLEVADDFIDFEHILPKIRHTT